MKINEKTAEFSVEYLVLRRIKEPIMKDVSGLVQSIKGKLFFKPEDKYYLIIDRTNWYWGKKKINIFMLGIAYEGIAIPLFWKLLPMISLQ